MVAVITPSVPVSCGRRSERAIPRQTAFFNRPIGRPTLIPQRATPPLGSPIIRPLRVVKRRRLCARARARVMTTPVILLRFVRESSRRRLVAAAQVALNRVAQRDRRYETGDGPRCDLGRRNFRSGRPFECLIKNKK